MTSTLEGPPIPPPPTSEFVPPRDEPKRRGPFVALAVLACVIALGGGVAFGALVLGGETDKPKAAPRIPGACDDALYDAVHTFEQYDRLTGTGGDDLGQWGDFPDAYDAYWSDPNDNGQGLDAYITGVTRSFGDMNDGENTFFDDLDRCSKATGGPATDANAN